MSNAGPKLWVRGDVDGFFGLFSNSLANTLMAIFLISVVAGFPSDLVLGAIVPGIVISLAFGNIYFAWAAWKLGRKEGRNDVTAVPYGLSVPHYFIVVFAILLPEYTRTGDATLAWAIGIAWCFVHGIVVAIGAFVGDYLRKVTPRAAMLGTLAGVALTYIAMAPAFQAFDVAWLGLVAFGIICFGWLGSVKMPFKIPAGLLAIIVGTILGWITSFMEPGPLREAAGEISFNIPLLHLGVLAQGFAHVGPYLVLAIPLGIYLYLETLLNIESAEVGGDKYNVKEITLAAAGGTFIAALFGSPVPTLVYIGHPGWKNVGARVGYSWATGVALFVLGIFGLLTLLLKIIPIVAIFPILIYIGMVILQQAFRETPARHAPAVALALIPWIADWLNTMIKNTLTAAGTSPSDVGYEALANQGIFYSGIEVLGASAILVGMFLAAIVVYIIDRRYIRCMGFCIVAAVCCFFGLIHSPAGFGLNMAQGPMIGYLAIAAMCLLFNATNKQAPIIEDE